MIFQPVSPLRNFQQRLKKRVRVHDLQNSLEDPSKLVKMSPKIVQPCPISEVLSLADDILSPNLAQSMPLAWQGGVPGQTEGTVTGGSVLPDQLKKRRELAGTTNSSPTDLAYMPTQHALIDESVITTTDEIVSRQQTIVEEFSFFESDTEYSDDESPVIGRASSVRTATPCVVSHVPTTLGRIGTYHGQHLTPSTVRPPAITSESAVDKVDVEEEVTQSGILPETIQIPDEYILMNSSPPLPQPLSGTSLQFNMSPTTKKRVQGGLRSNPVTQSDMISVHRANTMPNPKESNRKVRIRPSDLVITHAKDNSRFRESLVSTPYPSGIKSNEPYSQHQKQYSSNDTSSTIQSGSLRTPRIPHNSDRFPSPHHPEVLFIDLSLARHPTIVATIEIKITAKDHFDDEMLFRQLRTTYHQRMLGWPRLPFCLVRIISHVTLGVESIDNSSFNTADFTRHFSNPRIGSKRKTWAIWLRNNNRQRSPVSPRQDTDHFTVQKRPITPRPAEKRLSMHSDSTSSIANFSILPPLNVARIPFFRDRSPQPQLQSQDGDIEKQQHLTSAKPNSCIRIDTSVASAAAPHPVLIIHHTFSPLPLLLFFLLSILSAVTAATLWIVFGVPGNRPGQETDNVVNLAGGTVGGGVQWGFSAQGRVLTGLVLGFVVLVVGWVGEAVMILGGWVLM